MEFVNHTPFPALAFAGIDPHDQSFQVVVLRQTLTWNDTGELIFAGEQAPLCEADAFFGEDFTGGVRQESDLCQYKPRCDVIVNATAYAPHPTGQAPHPLHRFDVRLVVKRPDTPAPLPPEPHGLNPLMSARPEEHAQWRAAVAHAQAHPIPGPRLIDKTLSVTGERFFTRRSGLARTAAALVKLTTLGRVRPSPWRLTAPQPVHSVPLRNAFAFGGQCRLEASHPAADKVDKKHRLTPEQHAAHPDAGTAHAPPVAHAAFAANPAGRGYITAWHANATGAQSVPAPQIEHPRHPVTVRHFEQAMAGTLDGDGSRHLVAGLGIRPKGHPVRAKLVGTIDDAFINSGAALPEDFDFAVWNAAWPDQQIDFPQGDEIIELTNLCAPESPGVTRDARGDTLLRLALPGQTAHALVRLQSGEVFQHPMRLDTVVIDPGTRQLALVWRAVLAEDDGTPIRAVEAQTLSAQRRDAFRRDVESIKAHMGDAAAQDHKREVAAHG